MKKLTFTTSFLFIAFMSLAQINERLRQKPKYNFQRDYSFDSLIAKSQDNWSQFTITKEVPTFSPYVLQRDGIPFSPTAMPICHPELSGYRMPVQEPDPSMRYALLITPPEPKMNPGE